MRISDWSSDVCSSDLDGKLSGFDPGDAGRAIPAPFAQWVAAFEKIARDGRGMGIAPRVSRRCVVADKANDLLAARPGVLGRFPLLEKGVLRGDLPFERALGLDGDRKSTRLNSSH